MRLIRCLLWFIYGPDASSDQRLDAERSSVSLADSLLTSSGGLLLSSSKKFSKLVNFTSKPAFLTLGAILQEAGVDFDNIFIGVNFYFKNIYLIFEDDDQQKIFFVENHLHLVNFAIKDDISVGEKSAKIFLNAAPPLEELNSYIVIKIGDLLKHLLYTEGKREFFSDEEVWSLLDEKSDFQLNFFNFKRSDLGIAERAIDEEHKLRAAMPSHYSVTKKLKEDNLDADDNATNHLSTVEEYLPPKMPGPRRVRFVDDGEGNGDGAEILVEDEADFAGGGDIGRVHEVRGPDVREREVEREEKVESAIVTRGAADSNEIDRSMLSQENDAWIITRESRYVPEGEEGLDESCDDPVKVTVSDFADGESHKEVNHKFPLPGEIPDYDSG